MMTEYEAASQGAVLRDASEQGRVVLRGRDRAALLHRLSTNDIQALLPGQGCRTVLTNHHGRILDVLTVYALPEELLLVAGPGQGETVARHFRRNIFFRDQVMVEEATSTTSLFFLFGPQAPSVLLGLGIAGGETLALHHHRWVRFGDADVLLARELPIGGWGFALMAPAPLGPALRDSLLQAGALPLSPETFDILRVERGYGRFGQEFTPEYIPLEAGLWEAVSFTKGCYVGQEIIARMESRHRIARLLVSLRLSGPVATPAKLAVAGQPAGTLTSVVVSPRFGPIGLAYLRREYTQPGQEVEVFEGSGVGEVVKGPFVAEQVLATPGLASSPPPP